MECTKGSCSISHHRKNWYITERLRIGCCWFLWRRPSWRRPPGRYRCIYKYWIKCRAADEEEEYNPSRCHHQDGQRAGRMSLHCLFKLALSSFQLFFLLLKYKGIIYFWKKKRKEKCANAERSGSNGCGHHCLNLLQSFRFPFTLWPSRFSNATGTRYPLPIVVHTRQCSKASQHLTSDLAAILPFQRVIFSRREIDKREREKKNQAKTWKDLKSFS